MHIQFNLRKTARPARRVFLALWLALLFVPGQTASAQDPSMVPQILYQRGSMGFFRYDGREWTRFDVQVDDPVVVTQISSDVFIVVEGFINEREEVDVRDHELNVSTGVLSEPPQGLGVIRFLNNGHTLRGKDVGPGQYVMEYDGPRRLRVVQPYRAGFKNYMYLPDGAYHFEFQPEEVGQDGPTLLFYSDGRSAPRQLVAKEWLFYPRFVNGGSHIVYLHRTSQDDENGGVFDVEAVEVRTGQARVVGTFRVPAMSNVTEALFFTAENSPYVAIDDHEQIRIIDVTSGTAVGSIRSGGRWMIVPALNEAGPGYSLGSLLLLENQTQGLLRGYRLPSTRPVFEIALPGGPQEENWATRAVDLRTAPAR